MSRIKLAVGRAWLAMIIATMGSAAHDEDPLANVKRRPWQAGGDTIEISLWPKGATIARSEARDPEWFGSSYDLVGGRPVEIVRDVSRPTLTLFPAKGANSGVTIMVIPGDGYRALAIDLEGTEVCDWLTSKGITCALLKYRVSGTRPYWNVECHCRLIPKVPIALQDAQRAIGILRQRAEEFHIDRQKLGVLGFSTSGQIVAVLSAKSQRGYAPLDRADKQSTQPDFVIALSPKRLWEDHKLDSNPTMKVEASTSPTLILQRVMDPIDDVDRSLAYYLALRKSKVRAEMQFYAEGGDEAGMRSQVTPTGSWPFLLDAWLHAIGVLDFTTGFDPKVPASPTAAESVRSAG